MAYKGTDLASHGIFDIDRLPSGKLKPSFVLFANWRGI